MTAGLPSTTESHVLAEIDEDGVLGIVTIAPRVLIEIIEMTALDVPGVVKVTSGRRSANRRILPIRSPELAIESGNWHSERGISVRISDDTVDASVSLSVRSGTNVPDLAEQVQARVAIAIEKMLGMKTGPISVHIIEFTPETDRT